MRTWKIPGGKVTVGSYATTDGPGTTHTLTIETKAINRVIPASSITSIDVGRVSDQQKTGCVGCLAMIPILGWLLIPFTLLAPRPWCLVIRTGGMVGLTIPIGKKDDAEAIRIAVLNSAS